MTKQTKQYRISKLDRLYSDEGGFDFIDRSKLWYGIAVGLLMLSIAVIFIRGFTLSIDFEGGTKINMPAGDLTTESVEETFVDAVGIEPEMVQIVGSGDSEMLEITTERLSQEQVDTARGAIYEEHQPLNAEGEATPDAIGSSTVSESWGSSITERMLLAMLVFLVAAIVYVALRLQVNMAFAAIIALIFDAVVIAGIYALFGLEVSPAVIIGLLTVLTFSLYDSVIVFDKVNENTVGLTGQRKHTYAEQTNLAVNQTVMRSISTSVISALPIVALFVIAVWLMGIGTLRDLALVQLIGVVEGIFSSLFLATPLLVTIANRSKKIKRHNEKVAQFRKERAGLSDDSEDDEEELDDDVNTSKRTVASPSINSRFDDTHSGYKSPGATWRPGRN